ncbi:lipid-A-disaccharide synthase [Candidatus Pandoraea novymonadis]|uniref:Lipid-A-disaccharide synthase n=1 Tax=Candidatus Pandoraea novymonadis TaxID=1808959 RepID=A0ABX5FEZ4_9BURK|nr:lipid-A-disaccharide synthase [Candidatus Pandoraea novymonadis]PSB92023.1 Lipid-A-disaccharide synthase [Candidatus Pandoraea novymonadis]
MVAGELSGDLIAGSVLKGLKARWPADFIYTGIGGPHMGEQGFNSLWPISKLSLMGYVELIKHIPEILLIRHRLRKRWLIDKPLGFVGVDAPDFNFDLEIAMREAGVPTIHFVSPSIWAWRSGRIKKIKRAVDHMLCLFPFEVEIYKHAGIDATFVGHPLADKIPIVPDVASARAKLGLTGDGPIIAILPGSRVSEVERLAPIFFAAMKLLAVREPGIHFVLPVATSSLYSILQPLLNKYDELSLSVVDGRSHIAIEASDIVLLASGTATLEAALYKKPMVISYKVLWISAQIMKRQGYLPYVGLPNILLDEFVVPEFLQDFATPQALCTAVLKQLQDFGLRDSLRERFTHLHLALRHGTADRSAEIIDHVLRKKKRL